METVKQAQRHLGSPAVRIDGLVARYEALLQLADQLQTGLSSKLPQRTSGKDGPRVGVWAEPGVPYVGGTWATWLAGGISVPLAVSHPPPELEYVIRDAGVSVVIAPEHQAAKLQATVQAAGAQLMVVEERDVLSAVQASSSSSSTNVPKTSTTTSSGEGSGSPGADEGALIIYTSGTTGRPKGALHTHRSLAAQVRCLSQAWQWHPSDTILHALPLHHTHGIVNALHCAHAVGACVNFLPKFSPARVWEELMGGDISVFMGVPTMYSYLLHHYQDQMTPQQQQQAQAAARALRLTVSGSAACPVVIMEKWRELSGQTLLERYGMTETGMILSNPYQGERRPGTVGGPLPGVHVKVSSSSTKEGSTHSKHSTTSNHSSSRSSGAADPPAPAPSGSSSVANSSSSNTDGGGSEANRRSSSSSSTSVTGELLVRGDMLFRGYWGRPEATAEAFDAEGYFKTGDVVELQGEPPYYRILGRSSGDIIKSGGFKISALDIEEVLMQHPRVLEVAVLGLPDQDLGQSITALVVLKQNASTQQQLQQQQQQDQERQGEQLQQDDQKQELTQQQQQQSTGGNGGFEQVLGSWCAGRLAGYQVPRQWVLLEERLPRNAMGKVNKQQLQKQFCT